MKHVIHRLQRGAALLAAMLTVALVATFAAGALWQQWKSIEVEGAERQRTQARWLLTGALDWARVILREDARAGDTNAPTDHLAEPWAVPLQEARMSSFLAALPDGTGNTVDDEKLAQQVLLSGAVNDLQGRLNVTNLLQGEQLDAKTVIAFERLFDALGVPPAQLSLLTQGLLAAQKQTSTSPLMPQRVSQLSGLGLSPQALHTLSAHVTVLPARTPAVYSAAPTPVMTPQPMRQACAAGIARATGIACRAATTVCEANVPMPSSGTGNTPAGVCWRGWAFKLAAHRCRRPWRQNRHTPHGARQARMT